jgi:DNA-directed RNA polymerase subunit omega
MQKQVDIDEPETAAAPVLPQIARPTLGRDNPADDMVVDTMTEDALLRGLQQLTPQEPSATEGRPTSPLARRYDRLTGRTERQDDEQ